MKLKNIIYTTAIAALLMSAIGGCSKKKFDINANPDDVTDVSVTPSVLLPGALQATSSTIASEYWFLEWWMGHGARSGSYQSLNEEETYKFTNDFHVGIWNQLYSNANNYNLMVNKAVETGQGTYEAIGRIMKSHNFQILTDIYGNIPYSEAFQGTAVPTPKYDKGLDIYKGIFADLDKAIVLLNDADATDPAKNPDIASADIVYAGNTTSWKRFANTLRLRMLIHLYNGIATQQIAPGIDIPAQMAKVTSDGFIGAGQSAHLNPGFSGSKPNPYYRFYHTNEAGSGSQRDHLRASKYAIDYYNYDGDPRVSRFYVAPAGGHKGIPFGTPSGGTAPLGDQLSTIRGPGLIPNGAASRAWIFTSVESLFLQAEARQRGLIITGPTAFALLTSAIRESFVWLGLTSAQADAYILGNATYPDVDYNAAPLGPGLPGGGLYTILQQKWFALNMIAPYELWTDWRRTDIVYGIGGGFDPGPTISVDPNHAPAIPIRLFYPQNEYNYNAANVSAEGTVNVFTSKLFWDLN
ncbi:MAG: SusD/RagB family nutrient-binding outer membrane lipoprotein [Chitinophagaceae bacterium]|nr:SusD/RagB family nutrient-binding outer membrane lipoprotein [Chitinophagaceae bacterium]